VGAHIGKVFQTRNHLDEVMEDIPINRPGHALLVTILRETLIRALVNACQRAGVEILTHSLVTGADPEGRLRVKDSRQQGAEPRATPQADLVVAADGIGSLVRQSLGLLQYRVPLRYGATRMLVARSDHDNPHALLSWTCPHHEIPHPRNCLRV